MTNDKRGEVERLDPYLTCDTGGQHVAEMIDVPDGAYIRHSDHARIVATLAAENQALRKDAEKWRAVQECAGDTWECPGCAYLERHAYWSDARDFAPGGSWAAYVHAPTGRPTFTQAVDAAIAKEAGNG
jgi:hypothetical protein